MNQPHPLPRAFYHPSAAVVAKRLLGHLLLRRTPAGLIGGPIVETEAYLVDDPACHAAPGLTARNRVMFGPPGRAYVYFIYGCHYCVNAVCQAPGIAEAVLIRAIEPELGVAEMARRRQVKRNWDLTNGPAKLAQAMDITRPLNGVDLCMPESELFIAENPTQTAFRQSRGPIVTSTRIGISVAASLPLRFYLQRSAYVSRR